MVTAGREDDIAIIGTACRVAGAKSPAGLWESLMEGRDVQSDTKSRFTGYYQEKHGKSKGLTDVHNAYLIEEGIDRFDNDFFGIAPVEASAIDPQQRLLLEVTYEALEGAGIPLENLRGTDTAVFAGLFTSDYGTSLLRDIDTTPKYHSTGTSNSIAANRISYFFDLHGPSMVIDTACSSTITALHQAISCIKAGDSKVAIVCGANLILNPDMFVTMSELGFLSPRGRCHSFDASGDGYARGEGVLSMIIKPLADAIADNDPIKAVIKGTRLNQDGKTGGITLPSGDAQQKNMERLYQRLQLNPDDIQYFEAHGTGTRVGDPIEMGAIERVFASTTRKEKLIVGSVKSNCGHLESCAALIGIIKAVECMERGFIPGQLHLQVPNPKINFDALQVPLEPTPWPATTSDIRRAVVNSFGFGGANGHLVLETFPVTSQFDPQSLRPLLFKLSAGSGNALQKLRKDMAASISKTSPSLTDLSYTTLFRRSTLRKSHFVTASTIDELVDKLQDSDLATVQEDLATSKIAFVFTGQGAQWPEMSAMLLKTSPLFASAINACDEALAALPDPPGWTLREELVKPGKTSNLGNSQYSQPLCTAVQLGLLKVWRALGVQPVACVGHSSGEIAAAYCSGLISLEDAIVIAYYRGVHMSRASSPSGARGAMAAVGLGPDDSRKFIKPWSHGLDLACINSPTSCTISGDEDCVDELVAACKDVGVFCRKLRVDTAFHSRHMLVCAEPYQNALRAAKVVEPRLEENSTPVTMFSSVTGRRVDPIALGPSYWATNMTSTVRFSEALATAAETLMPDTFLEIGPHPALKGPAMDTLTTIYKDLDVAYIGTLERNKNDCEALLASCGNLLAHRWEFEHTSLSLQALGLIPNDDSPWPNVVRDLPSNPWDHSTVHWAESRVSVAHRFRKHARSLLLGARLTYDTPISMCWRNVINVQDFAWLANSAGPGLPTPLCILMLLEAARQVTVDHSIQAKSVELLNMKFVPSAALVPQGPVESIETLLYLDWDGTGEAMQFSILAAHTRSGKQQDWSKACEGVVSLSSQPRSTVQNVADTVSDTTSLEFLESLGFKVPEKVDEFLLGPKSASASFDANFCPTSPDSLDQPLFSWIVNLICSLMPRDDWPAEYDVETIESVRVSLEHPQRKIGRLNLESQRAADGRCHSNLHVSVDDIMVLDITKGITKPARRIQLAPPLDSLFYEPVRLPDIAFHSERALTLERVVELVTHKWPAADIGFAVHGDEQLQDTILGHLQGTTMSERPRFRSFTTTVDSTLQSNDRIRFQPGFNTQLRLLVADFKQLEELSSSLLPGGYILVVNRQEDRPDFPDCFESVCQVKGVERNMVLLRALQAQDTETLRALKIISTTAMPTINATSATQILDLESISLASAGDHGLESPFDAIILDCGPTSLLCERGPDLWMEHIKTLLSNVRNLLWVSSQKDGIPYSGASGAFMRTIASEHPQVKAASLTIKGAFSARIMESAVLPVMEAMYIGSDEVEIWYEDGIISILRYLPDDILSAFTGVTKPRQELAPLMSMNHRIRISAPNTVSVYPVRHHDYQPSDFIAVDVDLSVIDFDDTRRLFSQSSGGSPLGCYFAGKMCKAGAYINVVGHCVGSHAKKIHTPSTAVFEVPTGISLNQALHQFSVHATAMTILQKTIRVQSQESIYLGWNSPDVIVFRQACELLGCHVVHNEAEADFAINLSSSTGGYIVNGNPVRQQSPGPSSKFDLAYRIWSLALPELPEFGLDSVQEAFQFVDANRKIAAINHKSVSSPVSQVIAYTEAPGLFRSDAAYIIIGGFGGLGCHVMQWMIRGGARHLVVISRSGAASEAAQSAIKTIEGMGAEITALQANASDSAAVARALESIRSSRPIRGCLNMAIVLQNSPFLTMQPEQWNAGMRTKVDTTISLHQATIKDDLDFFIMFSSVSSIAGNRAQAAYAAGNAFQNAMAAYRRSQGLTAVAVALGAVEEIGTLAEDARTLNTLTQSGLRILNSKEVLRCVEAAVYESQHTQKHLLVTGFDMFATVNGVIQARPEQNLIFWATSAEFGHLFDHKASDERRKAEAPLLDQIRSSDVAAAQAMLRAAFLQFLAGILGYSADKLDSTQPIAAYGVDSLNAVACRFWFHKELSVDVPVFDVLGSKSIDAMLVKTMGRLSTGPSDESVAALPQPARIDSSELRIRPLSHSQSRLWFVHNFLADKTTYNLLLTCHIEGKVNARLLRQAWTYFLQRHEALHTAIVDTPEGWQQIPTQGNVGYPLTEVRCAASTFADMDRKMTAQARSHVFDPAAGKLLHGWLLVSPIGTRFYMASHHLAWDRGSVDTVLREVPTIYKNLLHSRPPLDTLEPNPLQFIDYTIWQKRMLAHEAHINPHVAYWRQQLQGIPECVSLLKTAKAVHRPEVKSPGVVAAVSNLEPIVATAIKSFCASNAATPFMFMTTMMAILVHRLSGDPEIVIGIADGDRGHTAFDQMVGFTVNMLPIKATVAPDQTVSGVLEELRRVCLEAYEHRAVPFDYLLQTLDIPRSTRHNPVFQITVNYQSAGSFPTPDFEDFKFTNYDHYNAQTQTDMSLEIEETSEGGMHLAFEFDQALYSVESVRQFARMFESVISQIIREPAITINHFDLVPTEDEEFIVSALQPELPMGKTIEALRTNLFDTLFRDAVTLHQDKPALIDDTRSLTYGELDRLSSLVARHILQSGVQEQESVGICCEPGVQMMIAIYGTLRARCVFVPINPDFPAERMAAIVEDTDLETVLVHDLRPTIHQKLITAGIFNIRDVQELTLESLPNLEQPLSTQVQPGDMFCSLFTSGSTGRPKGISIGHEQLRYQGEEYHALLQTAEDDVMLLSSSVVFDMSLHPIFGTILHGSTMVIASREERYSAEKMIEFVVKHNVSNCIFTPTQYKLMLRAKNKDLLQSWTTLRSLTLGGEAIPAWVLRDTIALDLPEAALFNGYAPTETTIINSLKRCEASDIDEAFLPLGLPLAPSRFYILDENMQQTPIGVPGELYIGGPTVNNGYLKNPELTDAAFLTSPDSSLDGGLLYRTGDSFCIDHTGQLRALGRISGNRQVKIRGMRVELDEIESVLYSALDVAAEQSGVTVGLNAVVYYPRDGFNGWLSAFIECRSTSTETETETQRALVKFLHTRMKAILPVHMRPNDISFVEKLPRTMTGKLDYKSILSWPVNAPREETVQNGTTALSGEIEESVAEIWRQVLELDRAFARESEFFSIGGSSLHLVRVRTEIQRRHGCDVALADMFAYPDIKGMASLINEQSLGETSKPDEDLSFTHESNAIDWEDEIALPEDWNWKPAGHMTTIGSSTSAVAMTGANDMIGSHLLAHLLRTTDIQVHCLASGPTEADANRTIRDNLRYWNLTAGLEEAMAHRIVAYAGSLAQPRLGLSIDNIQKLDEVVSAIYHLESDVSLLKRYDALRDTNVGSLKFLIQLAGGWKGNVKPIHYLSTWAVPHVQAWNATTRLPDIIKKGLTEMSHMRPGRAQNLGYLKVRWVCEQILCEASRRGIPANIVRASMCSPAAASNRPLPRTDINRRILAGSLQVGLVPDFGSSSGGGMSWIDADFLVQSMLHLGKQPNEGSASFHHVTGREHHSYAKICTLLGEDLRLVTPEVWFAALRASPKSEMAMQAEVLEEWWNAGWVPFGIENKATLHRLAVESNLYPPDVDGSFLWQVVGKQEF